MAVVEQALAVVLASRGLVAVAEEAGRIVEVVELVVVEVERIALVAFVVVLLIVVGRRVAEQ
jgi:hypothetical protein